MHYLFLIFILSYEVCISQCTLVSSASPYSEDFESSNGGWVAGGSNSDWVYGSPVKSTISSAGSGSKCWMIGGFTSAPYKSAQRSYLQSKCFDFSQNNYPKISFKIFWESEKTYDGLSFQSSIDSGKNWVVVGTYSDTQNCETSNWFNTPSINNLSGMGSSLYGWSGSKLATSGGCQGGGGSNGWVTAKHCLKGLGGKSNVYFRFVFGSGTACNDYDGVAIDDVIIDESSQILADFDVACTGYKTFSFTNKSTACATSFLWNFNDLASGNSNISKLPNPKHTFSNTSPYSIKLVATNPCGVKDSIIKTVNGMTISNITNPVSCVGKKDGSISITVSNLIGTANYIWYNFPSINNPNLANLDSGKYIVKVFDQNQCEVRDTIFVSLLSPLKITANIRPETCNEGNGSIAIKASGGTKPYIFSWSNTSTLDSNFNLSPALYSLSLTDAKGCTDTSSYTIYAKPFIPIDISLAHIVSCFGSNDGSLSTTATAGTPPFTYHWSNNIFTILNQNLQANNYTITITDKNNCTGFASYLLTEPTKLNLSLQSYKDFCREQKGKVISTYSGGTLPYQFIWSNNESTPSIFNLKTGMYSLTISDKNGCFVTKSINVDSTPKILYTSIITADTCYKSTGEILLNVTDGIPPFIFDFNNTISKNTEYTTLKNGQYYIIIIDSVGCTDSVHFNIPNLVKSFSKDIDTSFCFHQKSQLISPGNFAQYHWNTGSNEASIKVSNENKYSVNCTDDWGCEVTITMNIIDTCPEDILFPTAFSPNGDGLNDEFRPIYKSKIKEYKLEIFNRWGEKIHESIDPNIGWDGKVAYGVYIWLVAYKYFSGFIRTQSGSVELLK
jgi:hypothetical protein